MTRMSMERATVKRAKVRWARTKETGGTGGTTRRAGVGDGPGRGDGPKEGGARFCRVERLRRGGRRTWDVIKNIEIENNKKYFILSVSITCHA